MVTHVLSYFVPLYSYKEHYEKYKNNPSFFFIYDRKRRPLAIIKFSAMIPIPMKMNVMNILNYSEQDKNISNLNLDNPYRETFEKDLQDKINMSKDLLNNFDFEIIKKMTIMNSHGDYSVQQLIYNDNDKIMMIMRKKDY